MYATSCIGKSEGSFRSLVAACLCVLLTASVRSPIVVSEISPLSPLALALALSGIVCSGRSAPAQYPAINRWDHIHHGW